MPLTGRFDFRKTFFGKLVLQVEEDVKAFWSPFRKKHQASLAPSKTDGCSLARDAPANGSSVSAELPRSCFSARSRNDV